ncbi:thiamine biosynthesis lipoprotein [Lutibacter oricola]|uniref:FAD:protein FMN transferase n=1 Tax=Lutibacter oricola TaxID=762486 RepID=A0A1H2T067_9FLAO|nr:FAD:protein FMN transferase [Lutibacter oricola]SDW37177.1 thiamine biosynthesis lipoprotein [Lutibacter oricola]
MRFFLIIASFLVFISCQPQGSELQVLTGNAIGTTFSIRYLGDSIPNFEKKVDSLIEKVNKSTSTYIPSSDISKINKGDSTVVIDAYFKEVFEKSNRIYKETNGDFDPTVGVLVNAWGFGPEDKLENLDSIKIKNLLKFVGFNKVVLNNNKIKKQYSQIYFDFNAIGKGYLVDVVGRLFEAYDVENYLVEIGGEIRARGVNHKNIPWRIAIEEPNFDGTRSYATTIGLENESIATSGNYRKFRVDENGKKFVHTINAKTGYATESNLLSASVILKGDCADVDGYATAFMAMGLEKTKAFLKEHKELKAFLIFMNNKGELETFASEGLKE